MVYLCRNLKFGYFTQHFVDQLDMNVCGVEIMQKEFPGRLGYASD